MTIPSTINIHSGQSKGFVSIKIEEEEEEEGGERRGWGGGGIKIKHVASLQEGTFRLSETAAH